MVLDQNDTGGGPGLKAARASWRLDQRTKRPVSSRTVLVRILSSGQIAPLLRYRGGQARLGLDAGGRRIESRPVSAIAPARDGSDQVALGLIDENPGASAGSHDRYQKAAGASRRTGEARRRTELHPGGGSGRAGCAPGSGLDPDIVGWAPLRGLDSLAYSQSALKNTECWRVRLTSAAAGGIGVLMTTVR
jgi:hypothetical protein